MPYLYLFTVQNLTCNSNICNYAFISKSIQQKLDFIFSKKFGIRDGFNCASINDMKESIKRNKKRAKDNKYSYLTSEEIYDNIIKLLS